MDEERSQHRRGFHHKSRRFRRGCTFCRRCLRPRICIRLLRQQITQGSGRVRHFDHAAMAIGLRFCLTG
jgi:hypothetical protein